MLCRRESGTEPADHLTRGVPKQDQSGVVVHGEQVSGGVEPREVLVPQETRIVLDSEPPMPPDLTSGRCQLGQGLGPVVGDVEVAVRVHREVVRPGELARTCAEGPDPAHEPAGGSELLDPEIAGVADIDVALRADRYRALDQPELPGRRPVSAPRAHRSEVWPELGDMLRGVGDVDLPTDTDGQLEGPSDAELLGRAFVHGRKRHLR